jgi:hypothetical protein
MENQDNQEENFINEEEIIQTVKAKRIPSAAQLKHLENIRAKALVKKQQMREITEKAQLAKELDDKKVLKQKEKQILCQKYENHIKEKLEKEKESAAETEKPKDIVVDFEKKKVDKEIVQVEKEKVKPKKKVIKKIIYEEDASSSSEEEVKEVVVHRKSKSKPKKEPVEVAPVVPPKQPTYNEMLYENSLGRIQNRINDERARTILHSVIPSYY